MGGGSGSRASVNGSSARASEAFVVPAASGSPKKKLSYMEQREWDGIEGKVDAADARLDAARAVLEDPAVSVDAVALTAALAELERAQAEHDAIYERWAALSEKVG